MLTSSPFTTSKLSFPPIAPAGSSITPRVTSTDSSSSSGTRPNSSSRMAITLNWNKRRRIFARLLCAQIRQYVSPARARLDFALAICRTIFPALVCNRVMAFSKRRFLSLSWAIRPSIRFMSCSISSRFSSRCLTRFCRCGSTSTICWNRRQRSTVGTTRGTRGSFSGLTAIRILMRLPAGG